MSPSDYRKPVLMIVWVTRMSDCRIEHILITRNEAEAADPWEACVWIDYFIEEAIERGYNEHDLPADAIQFVKLWNYLGERANGGHAQYYMNKDGDLAALNKISELLGRIGLRKHGNLIEQFIEVANENEDRINELYDSGKSQEVYEIFYDLDDSFAELERDEGTLLKHLHDWVLRQKWVVVDDDDGPATHDWLRRTIPHHPLRDDRMAARLRLRHAENHGKNIALVHKLLHR